MKRSRPKQPPLFDDETLPLADVKMPVRVHATAARLNPHQRTFNRLTNAIAKAREAVARWNEYLSGLQRRVMAELAPLEDEVRAVQRRLVERLDGLLTSGERLSKRHRAVAVRHLLMIIEELAERGQDQSLEAIFDRHSAVSMAEFREEKLGEAEAMLTAILGAEALHGHSAGNLDELFAHAHAKAEELEAARAAKRAERKAKRRPGPTKAEQAAARKEAARIEAGRSVREVFRKLASALHPDRERDQAERERKTLLMQRANQAYERNDLLALLEIQLEIEQIDTDHLSEMPEQRLRHYNAVLSEQLKTLEAQLDDMLAPVGLEFGLFLGGHSETSAVDATLDDRIEEIRHLRDRMEGDILALDDPRLRRALFDELLEAEMDDAFMDDAFAMGAMFDNAPFAPRRRQKRQR